MFNHFIPFRIKIYFLQPFQPLFGSLFVKAVWKPENKNVYPECWLAGIRADS
jgi:hypothetical protein